MSITKDLMGNQQWLDLIKAAEKMRPEVPAWDPSKDNAEDWKHKSAMRDGWDLCWQVFVARK